MAAAVRRSSLYWFVLFLVGFTYALFSTFASLWYATGDPQRAVDILAARASAYGYGMVAAGVTWTLLGKGLIRFPPPSGALDWVKYIIIVLLVFSPISFFVNLTLRAFFANGDFSAFGLVFTAKYWSDILQTPPTNIIALVRSVLLVSLARAEWSNDTHLGSKGGSWSPGTTPGFRADHTTRLLCGSAFLTNTIPNTVSNFFRNKHTAVAPEYGFDVQLLASVCSFIENRTKLYFRALALVVLLGFFAFMASAESVPPEVITVAVIIAVIAVWTWKSFGDRSFARSFEKGMFARDRIPRKSSMASMRKLRMLCRAKART